MNTKISFHQIAQNVATRSGISVDDAERFIKTLFEAASYGLENGDGIIIPGLGTFRKSDDTTNPVAFIPDAHLAKAVNAPFEMFEPQVLAAPENELEIIGTTDNENIPANENTIVIPVTPAPHISDTVEDIPVPPPAPIHKDTVPPVYSVPTKENTTVPPHINLSDLPLFPEEEDEMKNNENTLTDTVITPSNNFEVNNIETTVESPEESTPEPTNSRFGLGFILGLLCGIAVGALAMFILFTITTKDLSSEVMNESQMELESTQQSLLNIGNDTTDESN